MSVPRTPVLPTVLSTAQARPAVRFLLAALVAVLALTTAGIVGLVGAPAHAATRTPHVPSGLPRSIEPMTYYVAQTSCDPHVRPGTAKLAKLLVATYPSAHSTWMSAYQCATDGTVSEHYEGRAIDWMVDIHRPAQYAAAKATINWLLATDKAGNRDAMARRLGVMYIIYNNRIWGTWGGGWQPYNGCAKLRSHAYDNSCHRTHMHISLSWNGAMGTTSFWTKRVYPTNFGPCRASGMNWAQRYTHANYQGCPSVPHAKTPMGASATKRALVRYAGANVGPGSRGPIVSAVQRAFHVSATGSYNAATVRAVKSFQSRHHVSPASGRTNLNTWRALLPAVH